ncbi:3242_t:CDS:2 [Funneliformis geosporum]|uniref:15403_t:CDS:1 n=1 Tax=Funneliformis geosporum TaxID=1117311 RepID=A0A9W4WVJ9_9GLOM|nr:15403_t:CDS:2 [Funneliformis geosporum]CAI2171284.1 3242_t:CDS:2 [Funneliformis geosporum]
MSRYYLPNTTKISSNTPTTLNNVLEIVKKVEYTTGPVTFITSQTESSIQLAKLLKEILILHDNIQEVLTKIKDSQQSFDLVKKSEIEKKIKILSNFNEHIASIMSHKQSLLMRLKEPFVELFPKITQSIASLPNDMESISWIKNHDITDEKIDNQLSGVASLIAMYGNYSDSLDRVRQALKEIQILDERDYVDF